MEWRWLVVCVLLGEYAFQGFLHVRSLQSESRPVPENVRHVYGKKKYRTWKAYHRESTRLSLVTDTVMLAVSLGLFLSNAYARLLPEGITGMYLPAFLVLLTDTLFKLLPQLATAWYDNFHLEARYGFNRMTKKTFVRDQVLELVLGMLLTTALLFAFIFLHAQLGDWILVLFTVFLMLLGLGLTFLYPYFSRIFNKFTPLEEGELRTRLTDMLRKNGYQVRDVMVMDASRRSTKSNAYFTGFGKSKTIVLYDTLVQAMEPDEICAVFAHEMGHGLHKDTLKRQGESLGKFLAMALCFWGLTHAESLYAAFGFSGMNYGFLFLYGSVLFEALSSLVLDMISNALSRRAEYRADAHAVREGYGKALISGLTKLSRENMVNLSPDPWVVRLSYSHPTLSQRIDAIEKGSIPA